MPSAHRFSSYLGMLCTNFDLNARYQQLGDVLAASQLLMCIVPEGINHNCPIGPELSANKMNKNNERTLYKNNRYKSKE